jgi:sugar phosphate isomerase/epimerase
VLCGPVNISRRAFLHRSALGLTGAWLTATRAAAPAEDQGNRSVAAPLRLGGPIFQPPADPEALARAHRQLGYGAAYCPEIPLQDRDRIRAVAAAFARHRVVIAEVGRWVNLLDADPERRQRNLQFVIEGLALAEEVGALCCVDIAGSFSTTHWYGPHPDNLSPRFFEAAVENARKIIDAVKPRRAKFCYEMMAWALPHTPDAALQMLKAVDRPAFAVHLDPCNLINSPEKFYRNTDLLNECFDKLGPWIVSCHAKDLAWEVEMSIHFREVRPGLGSLDYETYLRRLARLPHRPPLMLEHLATAEEYAAAARHLRDLGRRLGLVWDPSQPEEPTTPSPLPSSSGSP